MSKIYDPCPVALRGIVPSLHTPLTAEDRIDTTGLRRLVDWTIASGCGGMLIGAVAGETASLTLDEKRRMVSIVLEQNAGRIPVIVGISAGTQQARRSGAQMAKAAGAEWMLCQTPDGLSGAELVPIFAELAEAGPANLMIQDLSWHTPGMALEDIMLLFDKIRAFKALKIEVVPSGPKYSRVLAATHGHLHVSGGWAIMEMIEALQRGVHALIPSTMDPLYVHIYQLFQAGNEEQARVLFEKILPVLAFTHQHIHVSIAFSKKLRLREGIFSTDRCRPPVAELDAYQMREAQRWIERVLKLQKELKSTTV
jgi:4-hydroxy-tetrahydrodipicolinate synthase